MKKIKLTQGKFTLVDDEDYDYLNQWKWCVDIHTSTSYALRRNKLKKTIRMHRFIMNPQYHLHVDHKDGNGLNNQRENLRICTRKQNLGNSKIPKDNTSGIKGVCWYKNRNKWKAQINLNGRNKFLGYFLDKLEAKKAYTEAAKKYFGEFYSDGETLM